MDADRLGNGEKIAGISAVILLLVMFIFDWFGAPGQIGALAEAAGVDTGLNAWQSLGWIDIFLFLTVIVAIVVAAMAAGAADQNLPVAGSAIVAGMGILSVILVLIRIIDPPGESEREIGVFLGLIAAGGIAYGGWVGMQEEGTSFGDEARGVGGGGEGPGGTPPAAG